MQSSDSVSAHSQQDLLRLAELVRDLPQQPTADVRATLDAITQAAANSVPGAQHAGITLTQRQNIDTSSSTGAYPTMLDDIQRRYHEGPCLSAAWDHHTIRIDDLSTDKRWPQYRRAALEQTPIRSVLSFQLFHDRQTAGALNFYAEQPNAFDSESVEIGLAFATHAALAWNILRRDEQFRSALATRDVIGQAKGILMERFGIDAVEAFDLLKRLSQESNTPVTDLAHRLVSIERPRRKVPPS